MLKVIGIIVAITVASLLLFAANKPDSFRVERSVSVKAPPERVFEFIHDFKRWDAWSPWEKKDPAMKRNYGITTSGKGARYAWAGNGEVGKGSMEIAESSPPSRLTIKLDFIEPFEGHNIVDFTLVPRGSSTTVTWAMHGPMPYVSKVLSIFCNMDSMIGKEFEAGLASLKAIVER
jgi:uncharacterized protein YndB with AHSA1/START domain